MTVLQLTLPPWPMYRKAPLQWQKVREEVTEEAQKTKASNKSSEKSKSKKKKQPNLCVLKSEYSHKHSIMNIFEIEKYYLYADVVQHCFEFKAHTKLVQIL